MFAREHGGDRTGRDHFPVGESYDAIADCMETVEIMGDHEYGQSKRLL